MLDRINQFLEHMHGNPLELYSEAGFQHEFALFLRTMFDDLTVKLEYPAQRLFNPLPELIKSEIDIYVETQQGQKYVIELKMPKQNGGTPKEMYRAVEDAKFLEQLRQNGIDGCYSILITDCQAFWNAPHAAAGIYGLFNGPNVNVQSLMLVHLPNFLHANGPITLQNTYVGEWCDYQDIDGQTWRYYVLNIDPIVELDA